MRQMPLRLRERRGGEMPPMWRIPEAEEEPVPREAGRPGERKAEWKDRAQARQVLRLIVPRQPSTSPTRIRGCLVTWLAPTLLLLSGSGARRCAPGPGASSTPEPKDPGRRRPGARPYERLRLTLDPWALVVPAPEGPGVVLEPGVGCRGRRRPAAKSPDPNARPPP